MSDDFLSRWSRRKLEVRREQEARPKQEEPAPGEAPAPEQAPAAAGEAELTPEELEALPPIEELTADSDFTLFLRKGVPEQLKRAALRRMWSLDPAIRDYVGEARDYAWDWNVPGGVPGNGPLLPSDNVGELLRSMFGDAEHSRPVAAIEPAAEPVRRSGPSEPGDPGGPVGTPPQEDSAFPEAQSANEAAAASPDAPGPAAPDAPTPEIGQASSVVDGDAIKRDVKKSRAGISPPRRHGGAKPA